MQNSVKLLTNSLNGVQIRTKINESCYCNSEIWLKTKFGENILDYCKLPNGNYIDKMKNDDALDNDCDIENTLPAPLGAFILCNSKRNMNNSIGKVDGFCPNNISYSDTDSLYNETN